MSDKYQIRVIEWPDKGSAKRFRGHLEGVGWWVAKYRRGRGYTPLYGAYRTKQEALAMVERRPGLKALYVEAGLDDE